MNESKKFGINAPTESGVLDVDDSEIDMTQTQST
jgi:hypothetical protein